MAALIRDVAEAHGQEPLPHEELRDWVELLREQLGGHGPPEEVSRDWLWLRGAERLSRPPEPPLELAKRFLTWYVDDADGDDEIRAHLARDAAVRPGPLRTYLDALDVLLADPPADETLPWLVAFWANTNLCDPSVPAAVGFLRRMADLLREALSHAPQE